MVRMSGLADLIPNVPVGVCAVLLGALGAYVSLDPPPPGRRRKLLASAFVVLALLECLFINKQGIVSDATLSGQTKQVSELKGQVKDIQTQFTASQIKNAEDLGWLRGNLDRAIENSKQTLDARILGKILAERGPDRDKSDSLTDQQLSDAAIKVAQELRAFERQRRSVEDQVLYSQPSSGEKQDDFYRKKQINLISVSEDTTTQFRDQFLGHVISLRYLLLERLYKSPTDPSLSQNERFKLMAFDGVLAGPSPIADAADYLEGLARRLRP